VVARLADAAGMTVLVPGYSRSPEARYPVALEEMIAVYRSLIDYGVEPESLVTVSDSAGGGLALSLAMALRDRGIPGPAAIGLICPWADLAIDIDGGRTKTRDPLINPSMAAAWAPRYVGEHDPRLPGISPARGDMAGLPPIVQHSAGDDPLCIDADKIERPPQKREQGWSNTAGSMTCGTTFICRPASSPRPTRRSTTWAHGSAPSSPKRRCIRRRWPRRRSSRASAMAVLGW
jgi:hypothetical protein